MTNIRCALQGWNWIRICIVAMAVISTGAQTLAASDVASLTAELGDVTTTSRDIAKQIMKLTKTAPRAREYVVSRLPAMIHAQTSDAWANAVWLAGEMKASEAIPSLAEAMLRPAFPAEPYVTGAVVRRLGYDVVAQALSKVGNPAIPAVVRLLDNANPRTRGRALAILVRIDTLAARKALQDHLPKETDPGLRKYIRESLRS